MNQNRRIKRIKMITFEKLLEAMNKVEASGKKTNVPPGDNGTRIGPLQISEPYWKEAAEWLDSQTRVTIQHSWKHCNNWVYSKIIVWAYMNRWASKALMEGNWERIARVHNGGPNGWKKKATIPYWEKISKALNIE